MIRIPQVRVVDEEGEQLGVMPTPKALEMAQERGYDLVEVAPMASPPVARFLDFGQYKYELTKREKEAKRKQRSVPFKAVRLKPQIGGGDFDTKVRRALEFLEDGDRIKVAVQFRGRELTHPEIGRALLERFSERIKDHGVIERAPLLEGKSMHITVGSTHKPKVHETPSTPRAGADETARPAGDATGTSAPAAETEAIEPAAETMIEAEAQADAATAPETAVVVETAAAPPPEAESPAPAAPARKPRTRTKPAAASTDTQASATSGE